MFKEIRADADAAAFRVAAGRVLSGSRGTTTNLRTGTVATAVFTIPQHEIQAVADILLPLIGPVAGVLVRKQAEKAVGREDFYRRLAEFIPSEQDKAKFLALRAKLSGGGTA